MQLTQAGAVTLEQVNRLFALYEEIPAAIATLRGQIRGEVTVAASSTPGAYLVPELLRQFQEQYPEARPVLRVGDSAQVLEWLLDYQAPLGVIGEISISDGLYSAEIGSDQLQLVTSYGGRVCVTGMVDGISTSQIVQSLGKQAAPAPHFKSRVGSDVSAR